MKTEIDKDKYIQAYKWSKEAILDDKLLPTRTDEQIVSLISQENWLPFPLENEFTKKDIDNANHPNIYVSIEGNEVTLGLTLNKKASINRFKEIAEDHSESEKEELIDLLKELPDDFETTISKKLKKKHYLETPKYVEVLNKMSNKLAASDFDNFLETIKEIEEQGIKAKQEQGTSFYPIMPEINITRRKFAFDKSKLQETVRLLFPLLKVCLDIIPREAYEVQRLVEKIKEWENEKGVPQWPFHLQSRSGHQIMLEKIGLKEETPIFKKAVKQLKKDPIYKEYIIT